MLMMSTTGLLGCSFKTLLSHLIICDADSDLTEICNQYLNKITVFTGAREQREQVFAGAVPCELNAPASVSFHITETFMQG